MARIGLSNIITASFINRFRGLASSNSSGSLTDALRGGSSTQSISNGLRYGAQTFSNSLRLLNSAISFINISHDTLSKLSKVTDKLIDLTERASNASESEDTRSQLSVQFSALANEFRDTVSNSELGGTDYLSKDGLVDLFKKVGLDESQSESIAAVFSQFTTPLTDDTLASEYVQGGRPMSLSPSVYTTEASDTQYFMKKITNSGIRGNLHAGISTVNNVFADNDIILNQNSPAYNSPFVSDNYGAVKSLTAGSVSSGTDILAVNEVNGYSVISSSDDFLGFNPSGYHQLFIMDPNGNIVHQVTNNTDVGASFVAADISQDNLTVAYSTNSGFTRSLSYVTAGSLGDDPSTLTENLINTGSMNDYDIVRLNNQATYIAYDEASSIQFVDFATMTADAFLSGVANTDNFGFLDETTLGYSTTAGDFFEFQDGDPGANQLEAGVVGEVAILQGQTVGTNTNGYYAYINSGDGDLYVMERRGVADVAPQNVFELSGSNSIAQLSIALNPSNETADVGVLGILSQYGDTREVYRMVYNPLSETGRRVSHSTSEPGLLLDSTITNRPDAYRTLEDLKGLKEQISNNLKALDNAKDTINKNIDLVRAAGLSFLEISNQIKNDTDAETVAQKLQKLIRSNAGSALAQAENLEAIVVATLTFG